MPGADATTSNKIKIIKPEWVCHKDTSPIYSLHQGVALSYVPLGEKELNHENWDVLRTWRGHTKDVMHVAWSPDGSRIASCGVDNLVIVWQLNEASGTPLRLSGHNGMVKGVAWDPVGKYLASQVDGGQEKATVVWRVRDWQMEVKTEKPFKNAPDETMFLRLSWSPDGQYIATANAWHQNRYAVALLKRGSATEQKPEWESEQNFIINQAATVASFHPNILKKGNALDLTCAVGGADYTLSIWTGSKTVPAVRVNDLFLKTILDITWGGDGYTLAACGQDGTVAVLLLNEKTIGAKASPLETQAELKRLYGDAFSSNQCDSFLPEDISQLDYEQRIQEKALQMRVNGSNGPTQVAQPPMMVRAVQEETKTTTGKRRIMPQVLNPAAAVGPSTSMTSEANKAAAAPPNASTAFRLSDETAPAAAKAMLAPSTSSAAAIGGGVVPKAAANVSAPSAGAAASALVKPTGAVVNAITAASVVSNAAAGAAAPTHAAALVPGGSSQSATREPASAVSAAAGAAAAVTTAEQQQKAAALMAEQAKKRKAEVKGKPDGQNNKIARTGSAGVAGGAAGAPAIQDTAAILAQIMPSLPPPASQSNRSCQITTSDKQLYLNSSRTTFGWTKVSCSDHEGRELWSDLVKEQVDALAASEKFSAVGCQDGSLLLYSAHGRRLFPPLELGSRIAILQASAGPQMFLLAITCDTTLRVWDVESYQEVCNVSLGPSIRIHGSKVKGAWVSDEGLPLVEMDSGVCFSYHRRMRALVRVADDHFVASSLYSQVTRRSLNANLPRGPLRRVLEQAGDVFKPQVMPSLVAMESAQQAAHTVAHAETLLAAAAVLESGTEFEHWLEVYVRQLVDQVAEGKLREVCEYLLPTPVQRLMPGSEYAGKSWRQLSRGRLLEGVLNQMRKNRSLQRLATEFQHELDSVRQPE